MRDPLRAPRDIRRNAMGLAFNLAVLAAATYPYRELFSQARSLWLGCSPLLALELYRLVRAVLDREPLLQIDDDGVLDRRLKVGMIPWKQVTTMQRSRRGVTIGLSDPVRLGLRHTLWNRLNKSFGAPRDAYELRIELHKTVAGASKVEERLLAEATDRGITKLA